MFNFGESCIDAMYVFEDDDFGFSCFADIEMATTYFFRGQGDNFKK